MLAREVYVGDGQMTVQYAFNIRIVDIAILPIWGLLVD